MRDFFRYICEKIGAFCLFATHFHELTELEKKISFVANCHVDAQVIDDQLVLLHRIVPGPSTQRLIQNDHLFYF